MRSDLKILFPCTMYLWVVLSINLSILPTFSCITYSHTLTGMWATYYRDTNIQIQSPKLHNWFVPNTPACELIVSRSQRLCMTHTLLLGTVILYSFCIVCLVFVITIWKWMSSIQQLLYVVDKLLQKIIWSNPTAVQDVDD